MARGSTIYNPNSAKSTDYAPGSFNRKLFAVQQGEMFVPKDKSKDSRYYKVYQRKVSYDKMGRPYFRFDGQKRFITNTEGIYGDQIDVYAPEGYFKRGR
jgi:hypothetical protein